MEQNWALGLNKGKVMTERMTIELRSDDLGYGSVDVVRLSERQFRLEDTPLLSSEPMYAGDVIETELLADGTHRFLRVVAQAPMRHYSWMVPRGWHDSPRRDAYIAKVEGAGGHWEQFMGGLLYVHLPLESPFDAEGELAQYLGADAPEA